MIFCTKVARFVDQIAVTDGTFSAGGDSGSLIVTADSDKKPVGLLFAGSETRTFGNRIDLVLSEFGVTVDSGGSPPPPPVTTGPTVTGMTPADGGVNVAVNTNVVVTFSEAVNGVDSTTFYLSAGGAAIASSVTIAADRLSATLVPGADLADGILHTVTVTTGVTDDAGDPMAADFTSSFTTVPPPSDTTSPRVTSLSPPDDATGVLVTFNVNIDFSEPVDTTSVNSTTFTVQDATGDIAGTIEVVANGLGATFYPAADLAIGTLYTVTLTSGVTDPSGNPLDQDGDPANGNQNFSGSFTTWAPPPVTTGPTVTGMTPADGAINVAVDTNLVVTFSEAVNGVDSTTFYLSAGGAAIASSVTIAVDRLSATLVPGADLADSTLHTVTVTTGVTDDAGDPMATDFTGSFTTWAPPPETIGPTVTGMTPADGAINVAVDTNLVVTFSEAVNGVDSTTFFLSAGGAAIASSLTMAADRLSATLVPGADLANGTVHTVTVTTGVTDDVGDPMAADFSGSFTTFAPPSDTTSPRVTSLSPPDGAAGVLVTFNVNIDFSEPVDTTSVNSTSFTVQDATGDIAGTIEVVANGLGATFYPGGDLAIGMLYTVTLTSGVTDPSGNPLDQDGDPANGNDNFTGSFTTWAPPPDTTGPRVTSIGPPEGATGVVVTSNVYIDFSEPVDSTSVNSTSFTVQDETGSIAGTIVVAATGLGATFDPGEDLAIGTLYTVTLTSGITDPSGNPLDQDGDPTNGNDNFTGSFTTWAPPPETTGPTVTGMTPADGAINVAVNTNVVVTFSAAVNGVDSTTFYLSAGGAAIASSVTIAADRLSATLVPGAELANGTLHTVTVTTGVTDDAGDPMAADFSGSFTTRTPSSDTTSPRVTSLSPPHDATGVLVTSNVNVDFSEPVDPTSVNSTSFTVQDETGNIAGTIEVVANGLGATFYPGGDLAIGTLYTVTLTSGVTDPSGNPLDQDGDPANGNDNFTGSFTTWAPPPDTTGPRVTSLSPQHGATGVVVTSNVYIDFSEPLDTTSVNSTSFTVQGATGDIAGTIEVVANGLGATFSPAGDLAIGTLYTVTLTSGVTDPSGNPLDQDGDPANGNDNFTGSFTTWAPPSSEPIEIAFDDFESDDFLGGTGWLNSWSHSGDVRIRESRGSNSGESHARLRHSTGYMARPVLIPSGQSGVHLQFRSKVRSFEKGDEAKVLVSSDGSNWTSVHTFTVADSDNTYQFYDISLSNSGLSSNFWVAFDANMNSKGDWWSVDDVWIGIP